jgi:membrane protein DedA with SNARE-associated domain
VTLLAVHGALAVVVLAAIIFVEEGGVPLFVLSGDFLLISGGVLIASGAISPWVFIPAAIAASIAGGLVGYTWARRLGESRVRAVAERLRVAKGLDSVRRRIRSAGAFGIAFARLVVPGMRVNTTLLVGALGVPLQTFLRALIPSTVIWVAVFTGLGVLVGVPVERFLTRVHHALIQGVELAAAGVVVYVAARYTPRRGVSPMSTGPRRARLLLAVVIDLTVIATIVAGIDLVALDVLGVEGIDDVLDGSITGAVIVVLYFLATRGIFGRTAGEALLSTSYRPRKRGTPDAPAPQPEAGQKEHS